ncbi:hypothetical protein RJT34_16929 [Clitoria ternatea]|uniref:Uncharacterized protein n=1 Tax=Clitoria ternatea TaxID=43366 RepID=A0AAN9J9L7_CLITE
MHYQYPLTVNALVILVLPLCFTAIALDIQLFVTPLSLPLFAFVYENEVEIQLDPDSTDPPSPPLRHKKWKRAHTKKAGDFTSRKAEQVTEKILVAASPVAEPVLVPLLVPISTKGSCVGEDPDGTSTSIDLGRRCQLFLDGVPDPVAIGMVYNTGSTVHKQLIGWHVKGILGPSYHI